MKSQACQTTILDLPRELIASIIISLPVEALSKLCLTHSYFNDILRDDLVWRRSIFPRQIVNSSFEYSHIRCEGWHADRRRPPTYLRKTIDAGMTPLYKTPKPYGSYRQLYASVLREHGWMLGTWAGNCQWLGSLIEVFYNHRAGTIQCRRLQPFAVFSKPEIFSSDSSVRWRDFKPVVQAWDETVFAFGRDLEPSQQTAKVSRLVAEVIDPSTTTANGEPRKLWPTINIPVTDRIYPTERSITDQANGVHEDVKYSDDLMAISRPIFSATLENDIVSYDDIPRHTEIFYRLPRNLPAPTNFKQYSGLFMGDYSAHGPEILYLYYPTPTSLHAVKVTGDPNVPRGELSWVVDDLTRPTRICTEREWPGGRAFAGRGQICYHHGFTNPTWIETEVILYALPLSPASRAQKTRSPSPSPPTSETSSSCFEGSDDDDGDASGDEDDSLPIETEETTRLGIALWWKDMSHISQFHKVRGISRPAPQDFAMLY